MFSNTNMGRWVNKMAFFSPVYQVIAVPIEKIVPNTYNPNAIAPPEMKLLYDSITSLQLLKFFKS